MVYSKKLLFLFVFCVFYKGVHGMQDDDSSSCLQLIVKMPFSHPFLPEPSRKMCFAPQLFEIPKINEIGRIYADGTVCEQYVEKKFMNKKCKIEGHLDYKWFVLWEEQIIGWHDYYSGYGFSGASMKVWNFENGELIETNDQNSSFAAVSDVKLLPDNKLVVGCHGGICRIFDLETKECFYEIDRYKGKNVVVGDKVFKDGTVRSIYGMKCSIAQLSDNKIILAWEDGIVQKVDVEEKRLESEVDTNQKGLVGVIVDGDERIWLIFENKCDEDSFAYDLMRIITIVQLNEATGSLSEGASFKSGNLVLKNPGDFLWATCYNDKQGMERLAVCTEDKIWSFDLENFKCNVTSEIDGLPMPPKRVFSLKGSQFFFETNRGNVYRLR